MEVVVAVQGLARGPTTPRTQPTAISTLNCTTEREINKYVLGGSPSTGNHAKICFSGKQTVLGNIVGNLVLAVNLIDRLFKDSPDTDIDYG